MFTGNWPDVHVAALKERFADGMSFAQIAADINATFGTSYSRSACLGKAQRMKMTRADKPKPPRREKREPMLVRKPNTPPRISTEEAALRCAEVVPRHLSIYELTAHTCRWPYGGWPESKAITFCGCEPLASSPYCAAHFILSIGPGTVSERAAHRGVAI